MSNKHQLSLEQDILSKLVVFSKYARHLSEKNRRETFEEIVDRNKAMHVNKFPELREEIENAYKLVYEKKVLPSMRSFQFAGKPIEINNSRLFNCCALPIDAPEAFGEIMFLLLGGSGVGFSVQNSHVEKLPPIRKPLKDKPYGSRRFLIGDSIEGWADAIKVLMNAYFYGKAFPIFDFRDIRKKGSRLITSGGKAPGPEPLKVCLAKVQSILEEKKNGEQLRPIEVHDIICHIADCVLAGGIRRAALISLFSADDEEMLSAKTGTWWEKNPQRGRANNSAVVLRHRIKKKDFQHLWKFVELSGAGEPGVIFSNNKEWLFNPCGEASLRPFQFCNLTTINTSNVENQEDLEERGRAAAFIGTLQASYTDFHYLRSIWRKTTEKDALLGVSMTGIASGKVASLDLKKATEVVLKENERVAKKIGINKAARTTLLKPEGTSSLVLGCSSGVHDWHNDYYLRSMRFGKNEPLAVYLTIRHPELLEDCVFRPHDTTIVRVPQKAPENASTRKNTSAIDLLERVKHFSTEWVLPGHRSGDNTHNVSATITIKNDEWEKVGEWLWKNKEYYSGLSFLPFDEHTYTQPPFEDITKEEYEEKVKNLHSIDLTKVIEENDNTDLQGEVACGGGSCEIK